MRVSSLLTGRGQGGLELPGSDIAHSLKTAKLPGGMGLNSWGSPSLPRAGLDPLHRPGPSSETGQVGRTSQCLSKDLALELGFTRGLQGGALNRKSEDLGSRPKPCHS